MDGISNLIGSRATWLTIGGIRFELSVATLGDLARRERWVLSLRPSPLEILQRIPDGLPPVAVEQLLSDLQRERSMGQFVGVDDARRFDDSLEGVVMAFWLAVQTRHPEVRTFEDALALVVVAIEEGSFQELQRALSSASELDIRIGLKSGGDNDDDEEIETEHADGRRKRLTPWAKVVRRLQSELHMRPDDIDRMTYYRACVALGHYCPEDITLTRVQA